MVEEDAFGAGGGKVINYYAERSHVLYLLVSINCDVF